MGLDARGMPVSREPIDGGVVMVDMSLPLGHPDKTLYRDLAPSERRERARSRKATADQRATADRAALRIARNAALRRTDWTELPSAEMRLSYQQQQDARLYREALRDLRIEADAQLPPMPDFLAGAVADG